MGERERWLMAVRARLERVSTEQDLSPVLEDSALTEARELERTLIDDHGSLLAMNLLGWLHWYRYQALPDGHDQQDLQVAATMFTSCFINGVGDLPGPLLPFLADQAGPTAIELLHLAQRSGDQESLSAATDLWHRILAATPADHPGLARRLSNLGAALQIRFGRTGAVADLDAAIAYFRQAVQATPADDADRAMYLSNLGNALRTRFERTGTETDLDTAIYAGQRAVQTASADDPDRAKYLANLGIALRIRFERTGTTTDLDASIEAGQQAVQTAPAGHPDRAGYLCDLGVALQARFERTGTAAADLDAAVAYFLEAVQAAPADHPDRALYLSNLGNALRARFDRTGTTADLDAAIEAGQQAVDAAPAGHPGRSLYLSNLGTALRTRFQRTGTAADLEAAITDLREAVQAAPADHPSRAMYLSNLGAARRTRFERTGTETDLDAAIEAGQQAVDAAPADDADRALYLSNLGNALLARFERTGTTADLDAAIEASRQAVLTAPAGHPSRALYLSNLGNALRARFHRTGTAADLDAAIEASQQALDAAPADHPSRALYLSNLGNALLSRFERTGTGADLDTAISYIREAVQVIPADHPSHALALANLGNVLQVRFERTGTTTDLDAAIEAGQQAAQAIPADDPDRALALSHLGNALRARFERIGTAADLDAAFQSYAEAANVDTAPASARIDAGRAAALLVAEVDPGRAASLLDAAVALLPKVAPRFLERGDQQYAIGRFAGLAADAAALALSDPAVPEPQRPARALRLLEAARGVLLSQALSTRGDLSELHQRHPELAARFIELRDRLDRSAPVAGPGLADLIDDGGGHPRAIRDRRQADAEFTELLARIRGLEGFGDFALPPSRAQLEAQAGQGPVVVFNLNAHRSDAILLTGCGITSLRLPGLDQATAIDQINAFYRALRTIAAPESSRSRIRAQEEIRQVLAWLWDNAVGPVLDALGYEEQPAPGKPWPRLWWVPGGLLSLLPVHAAGRHASPPDSARRSVMDRVISSYTPTVSALAHARTAQATAGRGAPGRSLIVAMPTTPDLPGEGRLKYVSAEAALLQDRLPRPTVLTEPAADDTAADEIPTKAAVLEHLSRCDIAHFACHGYTDPVDPSQSQLLLHDHRRDPLTVAALAPLALDHAQLAYLSACSTARVDDTRLLDEAIHLTSAFQLAGFPHVIGTLWEINDAIAVKVADTFYTALTNPDGSIDCHSAARALHHATRTLRDRQPDAPDLWASYIHAGA